jgi:hypothetical protein
LIKVKYKETSLATKHKLSSNENKIKSNIIDNMTYIKTVSIYKFSPWKQHKSHNHIGINTASTTTWSNQMPKCLNIILQKSSSHKFLIASI